LNTVESGDEMNLHSVQDLLAEAELKYLMQPYSQIITPQESKPIIVITQDSLNAAYLMSTKVFNIFV
jgi:DNA-directed RNA polymerase beta' subunit